MLAEREIVVSYETIRSRILKFGPALEQGSGHNRLQSQAISQRYREGNTSPHPSESHILGAVGIPTIQYSGETL